MATKQRTCRHCEKTELEVEFYKTSRKTCKDCRQKQNREWYAKNKVARLATIAEWRADNKEKVYDLRKRWREEHSGRVADMRTAARNRNIESYRKREQAYRRKKYYSDPNFRLACCCRAVVRNALVGGTKSQKTTDLVGCSVEELWKHLEAKFQDGMTRDNLGEWHVDHIRPIASFKDLKNSAEEQRVCFHYTNLQPLWATDNLKKSNKWEPSIIQQEHTQNSVQAV